MHRRPSRRVPILALLVATALPAPALAQVQAGEPSSPPPSTFVNYDFKPGSRILFAEGFANDEVGDFPRRLTLNRGNMEVAEVDGRRVLRATSYGEFVIRLPEILPQKFTMELEFLGAPSEYQFVYFAEGRNMPFVEFRGGNDAAEGGIEQTGMLNFVSRVTGLPEGQLLPVRIMADGPYVKVYLAGTRVANVPNAPIGRSRTIRIVTNAGPNKPALFANIRVAAGGKTLYEAISATGRVATQGILFDSGSDEIRPESAPTLKEIGDMLGAHAELRLGIEGHTDNVGDAAANQALSERRAAAVQRYLVERAGIAADRLTAKGFGATKPAARNETPEGRQTNRRVELVRLK